MNPRSQVKNVADLETSLRRLGGDKNLQAKLAEYLLEDAPDLMKQLLAAHLAGDDDSVARRAHSLKGLAATFEPTAFLQLIVDIELLARARNKILLKNRIDELESEFERVIALLQQVANGVADLPS